MYTITTGWYNQSNSWVEGSRNFETLAELIKAYKEARINNQKVVYVGLSLSYSNSLLYIEREQIEKKHKEIIRAEIELIDKELEEAQKEIAKDMKCNDIYVSAKIQQRDSLLKNMKLYKKGVDISLCLVYNIDIS